MSDKRISLSREEAGAADRAAQEVAKGIFLLSVNVRRPVTMLLIFYPVVLLAW